MMYLDVMTAFEIMLYSVVVLLFVVTGLLNLRDFHTMRQDKWTRQDSVALMLRSTFWACLLNFLLLAVTNAGILLFTILRMSPSSQMVLGWALSSLEILLSMVLVSGLIYGVARWKDWYDLIDAEY